MHFRTFKQHSNEHSVYVLTGVLRTFVSWVLIELEWLYSGYKHHYSCRLWCNQAFTSFSIYLTMEVCL